MIKLNSQGSQGNRSPPKYLIYNKMSDIFGKIKADFIAEIPEPDFSQLCVFKNIDQ